MKSYPLSHCFALSLALVACGDDTNRLDPDAGVQPPVDAPIDTPPGNAFTPPTPALVPLAAAGPDQLHSVTAAPDGRFYAAGFAAETLTGTRFVTVVKYSAAGLDTTFDGDGIVTTTADFRGGAGEIAITTQPDGKILVAATVVSPTNAADRDIAVIRLLPTGALDDTFDGDGIAIVNFNDATPQGGAPDAARSIAATADAIYVHAAARGIGNSTAGTPRVDTDFTITKLTLTGQVDDEYATDGFFRHDIAEGVANPRGIQIVDGGKLLASGYTTTDMFTGPQPVLFKLLPSGEPDVAFNGNGRYYDGILAMQTEIYNFAVHGTKLVTGGYGRNTGANNNYVSLRYDVVTGMRDPAWGGAAQGAVTFDPSGMGLTNNCRNAAAMPGGKTLLVGSAGQGGQAVQDAVFAVLDAEGRLDPAYGAGFHRIPLGSNGADQFWGVAVSGNQASFVGWQGAVGTASATNNDNSFRAVFTLR
jgi:uncharacterized delta-60 repeat protein